MTYSWYKPAKWDWPGMNDRWYVAARYHHLGIGVVATCWGWRILLIRWQICIHKPEKVK
jgi:hypothetical protein